MRASGNVAGVELVVGLEVHIELATRTKMFSRSVNPAFRAGAGDPGEPNTLLDPTVLGLPGALVVPNESAIEMAMLVGMALGCEIARESRWDRKHYFYPDMPKGYQISQYDQPLCGEGWFDLPAMDERGFPRAEGRGRRIRIVRAHLEEDAGKLMHEAPGGGVLAGSIVDLNRAGVPLLEVVTAPDFRGADEVVLFARLLRSVCRALGVTHGVMQRGQMRFEPNINTVLTLDDGRVVRTGIVEVKNLNSFRALRGAIEHELREQPARWRDDGRELGRGTKQTRGWDDARGVTTPQREKEDAEDYRYFPEPDVPPLRVDEAWRGRVASRMPELPLERFRRYVRELALGEAEAWTLAEEPGVGALLDGARAVASGLGVEGRAGGRACANILLRSGLRRAGERGVAVDELGVGAAELGALAALRERGEVAAAGADRLFELLEGAGGEGDAGVLERVRSLATREGLIVERDEGALAGWVRAVLGANPDAVASVRGGRLQAVGKLVGEVMKASGGKADAKSARDAILRELGVAG